MKEKDTRPLLICTPCGTKDRDARQCRDCTAWVCTLCQDVHTAQCATLKAQLADCP